MNPLAAPRKANEARTVVTDDSEGPTSRQATSPIDGELSSELWAVTRSRDNVAITAARGPKTARQSDAPAEPSAEVYARFRARDESALAPVFSYYCERLVVFAHVYLGDVDDAEEAVSNAFLKLWIADRPIPDDTPVRAALYKATQSEALNMRKRERRRARLLEGHATRTPARRSHTPEDHTHAALVLEEVVAAVMKLPERMRWPFWLHWYVGCDYDEISSVVGVGSRAVKNYVLQAYHALRASLGPREIAQ